jgi:hypothetical protein
MTSWLLTFILVLFSISNLFAQSIVDDIDSSSSFNIAAPELVTEKIEKISASGRIFILTNSSGGYGKGDFISLVLDNKLINRAIVAKTSNGSSGIKIVKVYSDPLNKILKPGMEVQIIRGDDSYFNLKQNKTAQNDVAPLIDNEEGLFDETTLLEDDADFEDNKKRAIKTDNLISLYLGLVEGQDPSGESKRYTQYSGAWGYQLEDNIYAEFGVGRNVINDYPSYEGGKGLDTTFTSLTLKVKYTVSAPFYSYIQPYIGYQILRADFSADNNGIDITDAQIAEENAQVENLNSNTVIAGVTLLKRLVPGWFARLDIGTDAINLGFSLEF